MAWRYPPRPLLIGIVKHALAVSRETIVRSVPFGAPFNLRSIRAAWNPTVVAGAQTSPNLVFRFYTGNDSHDEGDVPFQVVTTPAAAGAFRAPLVTPLRLRPGQVLKVEVSGQSGGLPADVSITYLGRTDWEVAG